MPAPYLVEKLFEAGNSPGSDLVGVCAKAVASGDLKMEDAIGTLVVLLGAGGESTASLIGNATRMLADDPELQDQIRADHNLIEPFIEEALTVGIAVSRPLSPSKTRMRAWWRHPQSWYHRYVALGFSQPRPRRTQPPR